MFNKQFGALDRFMSLKRLSSQGFQAPVVTSRSNIASTVWGNVIRSKLTNTGLGGKKKGRGGCVQKNLTKKNPKTQLSNRTFLVCPHEPSWFHHSNSACQF